MQKNIILSMFEQKLFNLPCWPDINEHAAKEISQWSDMVEPLDWFLPLLCKIIWLYNRKFVKLLGLFLIRCVFTKKILGDQKFVKIEAGKNRGFLEHCAMLQCPFLLECAAGIRCSVIIHLIKIDSWQNLALYLKTRWYSFIELQ